MTSYATVTTPWARTFVPFVQVRTVYGVVEWWSSIAEGQAHFYVYRTVHEWNVAGHLVRHFR